MGDRNRTPALIPRFARRASSTTMATTDPKMATANTSPVSAAQLWADAEKSNGKICKVRIAVASPTADTPT